MDNRDLDHYTAACVLHFFMKRILRELKLCSATTAKNAIEIANVDYYDSGRLKALYPDKYSRPQDGHKILLKKSDIT